MRYARRSAAFLLLALCVACAKAPPTLSPEATRAFYGTQVIHDLDRLRDVAVDAHKTTPPLLTAQDTLAIVEWHNAAIVTVHAAPDGWRATVLTGMDEAIKKIDATKRAVLAPYVAIVKALLEAAK